MSSPAHQTVEPEQIRRVAARLELSLLPEDVDRLVGFGQLFLSWNQRINLGGDISPAELVERHFVDAFAASRLIQEGARVVDVGSGGGLPALPLAAVRSDLRLEMFEPTGKKVAFIRTAIRELGLKDRVVVHAERIGPESGGSLAFDVAMSRATWSPQEWLDVGRRLVSPGGFVLVFATSASQLSNQQARQSLPYAADRCLLAYDR